MEDLGRDLSRAERIGHLVTEYLEWRHERLALGADLRRLQDAADAEGRYERQLAGARLAGNTACLLGVRDDLRQEGVDVTAFLRWSEEREAGRG